MLMQPTIEKLHSMKLFGIVEAMRRQAEDPEVSRLSFEERLALLVDHQWDWRQNKALALRLKNDSERRDFLEICDDRYWIRSTVLTSQVPLTHWHDQIGDPTLADSILDRLVHNAHRIELAGASIRKSKNGKSSPDGGDAK